MAVPSREATQSGTCANTSTAHALSKVLFFVDELEHYA